MDASGWGVVAAVLGGAALFAGFWLVLLRAIAWMSGWRDLARAYPPLGISHAFAGPQGGETFRMRSAQLRHGAGYNNCITFRAGPAALGISMPRILASGHAPIEVPWAEIQAQAERVFWTQVVTLRFARAPSVPMRLRRPLAEALARASGGQLALPPERAR